MIHKKQFVNVIAIFADIITVYVFLKLCFFFFNIQVEILLRTQLLIQLGLIH
jgi:hypothetical protein